MAAKFKDAPSLRAFFYQAIQHPAEGGYFYAMQAIVACKDVAASTSHPVSAAAKQAAATLRFRCDFTEQDREDAFRQFEAIRELRYKDDPLLRQLFDSLYANSDEQNTAVLKAAIDVGNPSVIGTLVRSRVEADLTRTSKGEQAAVADETIYVLDLIECQLGADCGSKSTRNLALCIQREWCADSVPAALEAGLGSRFGRLNQLSTEILAKIRKRQFTALTLTETQ